MTTRSTAIGWLESLMTMTRDDAEAELRARGLHEDGIARTMRAWDHSHDHPAGGDDAELRDLISQRFQHKKLPSGWVVREVLWDTVVADHPRTGRRHIASVARYGDGQVWLHASVSRRDRALPTYDDLKTLHHTWVPDLTAVQCFVPAGEYVSIAEVLHLYACLTRDVLPDFTAGTGSI